MHKALSHSCLHPFSTLVHTKSYKQGLYYSQSPVNLYKYDHNNVHKYISPTTRSFSTSIVSPIGQLHTTHNKAMSVPHACKHNLLLTFKTHWLLSVKNSFQKTYWSLLCRLLLQVCFVPQLQLQVWVPIPKCILLHRRVLRPSSSIMFHNCLQLE